jgi:transcriptional regulator with XRE-family HTH domain
MENLMPPTFKSLWTTLKSQHKRALAECLGANKEYVSQIAHGRIPSLYMARNIALCMLEEDGETARRVDRKVGELFPDISIPNCPSLVMSREYSNRDG